MKPRDERGHPVVEDALGKGYLDTGAAYQINGISGHEAANQARKSIKVAGEHLGVSAAPWVVNQYGDHCWKIECDPEAVHHVYFKLWSKKSARQHVLRESGGDPANLKWNPFERKNQRLYDDDGRKIR